jgi:predicted HNH restriction endonuclease
MDFDHVSDKTDTISTLIRISSLSNIKSEISKCDLICSNCHRSRTHNRLINDIKYKALIGEINNSKYTGSNKKKRDKIRSIINKFKNKPCKDCGKLFMYYQMDLDHVIGDKVRCISEFNNRGSIDELKLELIKCDVVCSNCHRVRTYSRLQSHPDHK